MKRALLVVTLCLACPRERTTDATPIASANASAASAQAEPSPKAGPIGGARPVRAFVPAKTTEPAPVILVLHGYGGDGPGQLSWFGLDARPEAHVLAPDGTLDQQGSRFWNATDTCCDFEGRGVDDVKYLRSLVEDVAARHAIDRRRVYAVGLSNGGAMALRLACDAADTFSAVVTFAAPWSSKTTCAPKFPVSVRMLHGTADPIVPFGGGPLIQGIHPSARPDLRSPPARATAESFAKLAGCGATRTLAAIDLDVSVPGPETVPLVYDGCTSGLAVELFTLNGSSHVPPKLSGVGDRTWEFLSAHHR